jgi:hypothetical protein
MSSYFGSSYTAAVSPATKQVQRDKIDAFLEGLEGIPGLDYEVEGSSTGSTASSAASASPTRRPFGRGT